MLYLKLSSSDRLSYFEKCCYFHIILCFLAGCFLYSAWESILIGAIGGILACVTMPWFDKFAIDDPVGASSVHG